MHYNNFYSPTSKMSNLISDNFKMLLVMSRFNIPLGFGESSIQQVCKANQIHLNTFLAVINFVKAIDEKDTPADLNYKEIDLKQLIRYLKNSHLYFLDYLIPSIQKQLAQALENSPTDTKYIINRFFNEYEKELRIHIDYEEKKVFSYINDLVEGKTPINYTIKSFLKKHKNVDQKITELKNILIKYYKGEHNYLMNSVLINLVISEKDIYSHGQIEDSLFVPTVSYLESVLQKNKSNEEA